VSLRVLALSLPAGLPIYEDMEEEEFSEASEDLAASEDDYEEDRASLQKAKSTDC